jgi:hypothetical protein
MKNPMDRQLEKKLSERAVAIGREGEVAAFKELLELLGSSSANARRLAASALGKLAWMGVDQAAAVAALAPMARPPSTARDTETQRRPSFTQTPKGKKYKCGVNFSARVPFDGSTSSPQAKLRAGNGENKRHGFLEEDQEGPVRRFDKLTAGKAQGRDERGISSSFS